VIQPNPLVAMNALAPNPPARESDIQSGSPAMLSPAAAWRSLCARTGGFIALATFYRWLRNGKVYSIRLGQRIFIPREALDDLIKNCLNGERF
jgi:hypothetical protein